MMPPADLSNVFFFLIIWGSLMGSLLLGLVFYRQNPEIKRAKLIFFGISLSFWGIIVIITLSLSGFISNFLNVDILILFAISMILYLIQPIFLHGIVKTIELKIDNKSRKKHHYKTVFILTSIILVTIFVPFTFNIRERIYYASYDLRIESNSTNPYILYVPASMNSSDQIPEIARTLQVISGNASYSLITTIYGPAYNISANGSISIGFRRVIENSYNVRLSMRNESADFRYLFYYNSSFSNQLNITLSESGSSMYIYGDINMIGWNNLEGFPVCY